MSMHILYWFHGWLIFARVIALFMFVWPYVRSHILCTQLVICLLSHFIHIWYLVWPWSEYVHIIPISGWLIFASIIALFMFVWPYVPSQILCTQLVICLLSHFIHIWYLGWPWSEHAHVQISRMVDFCANCPGRIHISWFQHPLYSFMALHHVKSHYSLILYYTSTYVERMGVSQHDDACSFICFVVDNHIIGPVWLNELGSWIT